MDLSFYKESRLGMRWRTQKEVVSGKGQFVCGAKGCEASDGLCSYEVNFAYQVGQERQEQHGRWTWQRCQGVARVVGAAVVCQDTGAGKQTGMLRSR